MLYSEFQAMTNEKVSYAVYEMFAKMYMQLDMDKETFCKQVKQLVNAYVDKAEDKNVRLYRRFLYKDSNGDCVYGYYVNHGLDVSTGKYRLQKCGYIGRGDLFNANCGYLLEKGIASMTQAELSVIARDNAIRTDEY